MLSVFDLEKLRGLLRDFYALSHIRITVFNENRNEIASYPREVAPYCAVIRDTLRGLEACLDCDREACEIAAKKHNTYIYRCHAGLTEAVTPLYVGDLPVGYLLFGHVFSYPTHEEGWAVIKESCKGLELDRERLHENILTAQPMDEETVRSAAHILHAVASYLIMERMAGLQADPLAQRLDDYLTAHFTEELHVDKLCALLGVGKTQLYKLAGQLYGCGVAKHVRDLRMNLAKELLRERKELSLAEIAERCGYSDYNYFISVFSREIGTTPKKYLRNLVLGE